MALVIPFSSANRISKFSAAIDGALYGFRARWNERDTFDPVTNKEIGAWYIDVTDATGSPLATGIKVSLGTFMGRQFNTALFRDGALAAVDLSGTGKDPGVDDLGTRVVVIWLLKGEVLSLRIQQNFPALTVADDDA